MTTLAGDDTYFTTIDSDISQTQWEDFILQARDKINGYAKYVVVPDASGAAGSRSWSLSSMQVGFVRSLAVAIYQKDYKSAGAQSSSYSLGGLSQSQSASSGGGAEVEELAKAAAKALTENDWSRAFI